MIKSNNVDTEKAGKELLAFINNEGSYDKELFKLRKSGYSNRKKL